MQGKVVAQYRILEKLGEGGMGVVYRAEDMKLGRSVALKFLPDDLLHDREARDRFRREARLASKLNHPNICTIHDVEETEGRPFLVLELLEGRSLKARLSQGRLDEAEVLEIGKQVASALAAAHDKGVLHRDVKPANIFIGPGGHVKLLDFGLAKFAHPLARVANVQQDSAAETLTAPEHLTRSGATLGTVSYMSPEQALGERVDARSDLFSLGVVFYEMATGKLPFSGNTAVAVFDGILRKEPAPPQAVNPKLSEGLHRLILKALEKQPGARFKSASDLELAVEHLKEPVDAASARTTWLSNETVGWFLVAAAGALVFSLLGRGDRGGDDFTSDVTLSQFTAWAGVESEPSFSPDGNDIAFASSKSGNFDIYVQRVGGQNPFNLTADSSFNDTQPVFSPDGQHIAFRSERDGGGIFIMGATGESPRRVVDAGYYPDWSPDGSRIVYASETFLHPGLRARGSRLFVLDLATEELREIAVNDAVQPKWSPGGDRIAYWGLAGVGSHRDLWTVPVEGGAPVALTNDAHMDWGPAWSPDGSNLYFSSDRGGGMNLWRIGVDEDTGSPVGEPEPVTTGALSEKWFSALASNGRSLAYVERLQRINVQRVRFDADNGLVVGEPVWVTRGTRSVQTPDPSPDGERLAFSTVLPEDIIVARDDGSSERQLTNDGFRDRGPRWSPDGERIAFMSDRSGSFELWTIGADGRGLEQITDDPTRSIILPAWSPDGSRLAYYDAVSGSSGWVDLSKPWREQPSPQAPSFITWSWSPDGRYLAGPGYRPGIEGIEIFSVESREVRQLTDHGRVPVWLHDSRRLLFANGSAIELVDIESGEVTPILSVAPDGIISLAISRDNRLLYYDRVVVESDIWLMTRE